ncbi:integrase, catalytic region, zinc finger, CCHC-type containing protein, partial [Tanacetum coccineum]
KFITDVKLAKSLYTTSYDQLYAYLSQHERHANEVRINRERYPDSLAFIANSPSLYNPSQSPQHSGEDPIECINKVMTFLSAVASRFPPSNNQLRTSSNPRNQATIQDGRVTVQQVQGRQIQSYAGTGNRGTATTSKGNVAVGPSRVVKCYNCQGEGNMARQCTKPKRPRNDAWFKEKLMLAEAQEAGQILAEE